ncbi:MAG: thiamine phosphate synthase [Bacillota bacterium]
MKIYLITSDMKNEKAWLEKIERILKAGVDYIQYRDKSNTTAVIYEVSKKLKNLSDKYNTPLIINNRLDICMAVDADGVHLGNDDLPLEAARKILGPDKIIGASARTVEIAQKKENNRADYLGSGAVFQTNTKKDAQLITLTELSRIVSSTNKPVFAIGGINSENIDKLKSTGVQGVCLSEGLMDSPNPEELIEKIRNM